MIIWNRTRCEVCGVEGVVFGNLAREPWRCRDHIEHGSINPENLLIMLEEAGLWSMQAGIKG